MYKNFWFDQSEERNYIGSIRHRIRKEFEPISKSYMGEDILTFLIDRLV